MGLRLEKNLYRLVGFLISGPHTHTRHFPRPVPPLSRVLFCTDIGQSGTKIIMPWYCHHNMYMMDSDKTEMRSETVTYHA